MIALFLADTLFKKKHPDLEILICCPVQLQ